MRKWELLAIGFIGGIAVMKIIHHFEPPKEVEIRIPIPERCIPHQGPSKRDVDRNPDLYGRREIF